MLLDHTEKLKRRKRIFLHHLFYLFSTFHEPFSAIDKCMLVDQIFFTHQALRKTLFFRLRLPIPAGIT